MSASVSIGPRAGTKPPDVKSKKKNPGAVRSKGPKESRSAPLARQRRLSFQFVKPLDNQRVSGDRCKGFHFLFLEQDCPSQRPRAGKVVMHGSHTQKSSSAGRKREQAGQCRDAGSVFAGRPCAQTCLMDALSVSARRRGGAPAQKQGELAVACQEDVLGTSSDRMSRSRGIGAWRCPRASAAALFWLYCVVLDVVPTVRSVPPHQRACPGPLDRSSEVGACLARGRATLSDKPFRTVGGKRSSSDCRLQSGILNCVVRLSAGSVVLPVYRDGGFAGAGSISFSTIAGSAHSGVLFQPSTGSISWDSFRVRLHPSLAGVSSSTGK